MRNIPIPTNSDFEICFFIPCMNEALNVSGAIKSIDQATGSISKEIIIVDDGSDDNTLDVVRLIAEMRPELNIRIIEHSVNLGLGYSYFEAARAAKSEYYMVVFGDNVMSSDAIMKIIERRNDAEMVITYIENDNRSILRRLVSMMFTILTRLLSGQHLRYFNGSALHRTRNIIQFTDIGSGFGYQAELLCRLIGDGLTYIEIPAHYDVHKEGQTKAFRLKNITSVVVALCRILLYRIMRRSPTLKNY